MQKLIYVTNNAYDTVLLTINDTIVSSWQVTPEIFETFVETTEGKTHVDDWDIQDAAGIEMNLGDFGTRLVEVHGEGGRFLDKAKWLDRREFFGL